MPFSDDLYFATIGELSAKLRAGEVKASELAAAFAARLEKLGPTYNALAHPLGKDAARKAKDVDGDLKRGRFRSLLQGIPYGAKDLLSYAGHPTGWGAKPFAGQILDETATVLQKLEKTGALLVGKLAMVELAGGGGYRFPDASVNGPGLNPWDKSRWSGGSSSGSGSAVAAGLVPFALGSETNGSILTPAAYCGVSGLRPTYGLVSRHGAMALAWSMDKIGVLSRSAEDCGLVLQAIAGKDALDPASSGKSFYYTPQYARPLKDLRICFAPVDFADGAAPGARAVFAEALKVLQSLGPAFREARQPDFPYTQLARTIVSAEGAAMFEPILRNGKIDELADKRQAAGLKAAREIPAIQYIHAMRVRSLVQDAFRKLFREYDVIAAPTRADAATPITAPLDGPPAFPLPEDPGFRELTPAGNLAGLPALSLPCGFVSGLPVGLQLVGAPYSENTLLSVGKAFQEKTDWHRRRPPQS